MNDTSSLSTICLKKYLQMVSESSLASQFQASFVTSCSTLVEVSTALQKSKVDRTKCKLFHSFVDKNPII